MKHIATSLAIFLLLAAAGCQPMQRKTEAQQQRDRIVALTRDSSAKTKQCQAEIHETAAAKVIHGEVLVFDKSSPNRLDLLLSQAYLSDTQFLAMKEFIAGSQKCWDIPLTMLSGLPFYGIAADTRRILDDVYFRLMKKEVSIGQANELIERVRADSEKRWQEVGMELDRNFQQAHNDEIQGRQRAAAAMMPFLMQQQQFQQQQQQQFYQQQMEALKPRPTFNTNCTTFGNNTNCVTR